ncbi:hypothetical protein FIBSPDRAFT_886170 [Athelia psychrophila]|uniref:Uncharacterized protein n=1 Tax=Athelia psychrophila TaxID=1759441 RepID=A0A166R612_9AGAM|nr:hypothetical protein FIBSPDRAFT_886170 [Fibularhizoctonia sp. CBS 109695]
MTHSRPPDKRLSTEPRRTTTVLIGIRTTVSGTRYTFSILSPARYSTSASPPGPDTAADRTKHTLTPASIAHNTFPTYLPEHFLARPLHVLVQAGPVLCQRLCRWFNLADRSSGVHVAAPLTGRSSSCIQRFWLRAAWWRRAYDCGAERDEDRVWLWRRVRGEWGGEGSALRQVWWLGRACCWLL